MHWTSINLLLFLFAVSRGEGKAINGSLEPAPINPIEDGYIFTLEIPDYVIIEYHNATDYIKSDNMKNHVMGVSDERCDNANVSDGNMGEG